MEQVEDTNASHPAGDATSVAPRDEPSPPGTRSVIPPTPHPLPCPPFHHIAGIPNFRDVGGYPSTFVSPTTGRPLFVRRGIVFRSADTSGATDEGIAMLRRLGIRKVFDLRSRPETERLQGDTLVMREMDGVEQVLLPVFLDRDYSPEAIAARWIGYASKASEVCMYVHESAFFFSRLFCRGTALLKRVFVWLPIPRLRDLGL